MLLLSLGIILRCQAVNARMQHFQQQKVSK